MIASFTQTYGNERDLGHRDKLYEAYGRDSRLIEFKNMLDVNIHSFHDCEIGVINKYKSLNRVEKSIYLEHQDISYGGTIKELLRQLKILGVTHLFFSQDDTFSMDNESIDFMELLDYVKSFKENFMLSLAYDKEFINSPEMPYEKHESFTVHFSNTKDFGRAERFPMDDSPYIATMDIVRRIYGDYYMSDQRPIWNIEETLAQFCGSYRIPRFILDNPLFKNYNIIGRNTGQKNEEMLELFRKGILR